MNKLLRITAFVIRFIYNLKASIKKQSLTLNKYAITSELKRANELWIKDNQIYLNDEVYDSVKSNLNLNVDEDGVVRSYSRLKKACVPFDTKAPIFIYMKLKITELLGYNRIQNSHGLGTIGLGTHTSHFKFISGKSIIMF